MSSHSDILCIGVLALQGAFQEHIHVLNSIPNVKAIELKTPDDILQANDLAGIVFPGGESTAIGILAEKVGMIDPLKRWVSGGRPTFGTCAGLIMLADRVIGQKQGGQSLLGGLDVTVQRNYFGSQVNSFECEITNTADFEHQPNFNAIFIRAPAIVEVGSTVNVLASFENKTIAASERSSETVHVAVRQGSILAVSFHPELTSDSQWHRLFVDICKKHSQMSKQT